MYTKKTKNNVPRPLSLRSLMTMFRNIHEFNNPSVTDYSGMYLLSRKITFSTLSIQSSITAKHSRLKCGICRTNELFNKLVHLSVVRLPMLNCSYL